MIHKSTISKYHGSMSELAEDIGDLKYDALAAFLDQLSKKIKKDGDKDYSRNRVKLAAHLHHCATQLQDCKEAIEKAWVICEPYTP